MESWPSLAETQCEKYGLQLVYFLWVSESQFGRADSAMVRALNYQFPTMFNPNKVKKKRSVEQNICNTRHLIKVEKSAVFASFIW